MCFVDSFKIYFCFYFKNSILINLWEASNSLCLPDIELCIEMFDFVSNQSGANDSVSRWCANIPFLQFIFKLCVLALSQFCLKWLLTLHKCSSMEIFMPEAVSIILHRRSLIANGLDVWWRQGDLMIDRFVSFCRAKING